MATRLTGLTRGRGLGRPIAAVRSWSRLRQLALGGVTLLAVLTACSSTATYPVDIFTAMHFQHSYRTLEPPRFQSPAEAVPIDGRAPSYTTEQILQLQNPTQADDSSLARGEQLYNVNCAVCHGGTGNGDGLMTPYFQSNPDARPPAVLTADTYKGVEDNFFYSVLVNGRPPWMPAFNELLEGEDMWHLINYIRELQGASS